MEHLQILKSKLSILAITPEHSAIAHAMLIDVATIEDEQHEFMVDEHKKANENHMKYWDSIISGKPEYFSIGPLKSRERRKFYKIEAIEIPELPPETKYVEINRG